MHRSSRRLMEKIKQMCIHHCISLYNKRNKGLFCGDKLGWMALRPSIVPHSTEGFSWWTFYTFNHSKKVASDMVLTSTCYKTFRSVSRTRLTRFWALSLTVGCNKLFNFLILSFLIYKCSSLKLHTS